ncbi:MAG: hypothetical protein ABIK09_09655 [Pseudomonadota bacterium]
MHRILAPLILLVSLTAWSADAAATKLDRKEKTPEGTTYWGSFDHAPFPDKGSPYKDDTIALFVPKHFCPLQIRARLKVKVKGKRKTQHKTSCYTEALEKKYKEQKVDHRIVRSNIDYVVHFHGHSNTVAKAMRNHRLREQFGLSLQNAILIVPQGPVNSVDSADGKMARKDGFRNMMYEIHGLLRDQGVIGKKQRIGNIIVSSHSGGYRAAAHVLSRGGIEVREIFFFDSLYANVDEIFAWVKADKTRKFINLYFRDKPRMRSKEFLALLAQSGVPYVNITTKDLKKGRFSRKDLYRKRVIFIETELGHSGCTNKYLNYRDYLYASCLHRYHSSDWFQRDGLDRIDP